MMNIRKMNKGLDFLRRKYGAAEGIITVRDGHCYVVSPGGRDGHCYVVSPGGKDGDAKLSLERATPLIPGRMERKIVELKKFTENGTLEGVSTLRFASFGPKGSDLEAMLAKELDLAAYLGASDIVRVMAVASFAGKGASFAGKGASFADKGASFADKGAVAINVLAKLANDINVSVEVGAMLPKGALGYDRHEIIAKRGVGCDQTVDTHTPHASIRCWDARGAVEYTDVDTELFGMTYEEIWNVRAAFALLQKRADARIWKSAWAKAVKAARLAFKADATKRVQTIALKKGIDTNTSIKVAEVR